MIRRPPRSTLFPTRRSSDLDVIAAELLQFLREHHGLADVPAALDPVGDGNPHAHRLVVRPRCAHRGDRKSTRLNSSHPIISYALFCFKKKNSMSIDTAHSHH